MKFGGIGIPELLIILVVILLIFGPKNLPKLGKSLGKTVRNVREGMNEKDEPAPVEAVDDEPEQVDEPVDDESADDGPEAQRE